MPTNKLCLNYTFCLSEAKMDAAWCCLMEEFRADKVSWLGSERPRMVSCSLPTVNVGFIHNLSVTSKVNHICFKSSIKPLVSPEGVVWSLINVLEWCHLSQCWLKAKSLKIEKSVQTSVAPHLCCRLEAPGYISRYWYNTPRSLTKLSAVELHIG